MSLTIEDWVAMGVVGAALTYLVLRVTGLPRRGKRSQEPPVMLGPRLARGLKRGRRGCCDGK